MKTALFVGRFQPMHNSHLSMIKNIIKDYKLILAIGRAQESRTSKNPFSKEERRDMINQVLKKENISCEITFIPDKEEDEEWLPHVKKHCPKFDIVFTGNPETKECCKEMGFKTIDIELIGNISSTKIREMILEDKEWKTLVPLEIYNYINNFGIKKLKNIIQKPS